MDCNSQVLSGRQEPSFSAQISVEIFKSAFSFTGLGVVLAYLSLIAGLHFILPAKKVSGTQLKDGSKLTYRMNALFVFGITYTSALVLAGLRVYAPELAVINLAWAAEHFLELATATVLICVAMSGNSEMMLMHRTFMS